MEMQAFPERIVNFCDRADPGVAANINQAWAISAEQRRIRSRAATGIQAAAAHRSGKPAAH
jgi:hypothetical protein